MGNSFRLAAFLLFSIITVLYVDQNLVVPLIITLRNEGLILGDERTWFFYAALLGTVTTVSGISTAFIWGYVADKISRKKLLAIAVLVGEIPTFLTAFSRSYWELLFYRSFTGIGLSGSFPIAKALVADIYPAEKRGRGFAFITAATGGGSLAGMVMAGLLPDWRISFIIAALPNFLLVPLFLFLIKEIRVGYSEPEIKKLYDEGKIYGYKINVREFVSSLKDTKTILFILLQGIPGTVPWGSIPYWSITYMNIRWGIERELATIVLLAGGIGMILGNFLGGAFSDLFIAKGKRNARIFVPISGISLGTAIFLIMISYPYPKGSNDFLDLIPLLTIVFIGLVFASFSGPNVPTVLSDVSLPEHRGSLYSIFSITDNIGAAFAPLVSASFMAIYSSFNLSESEAMYYGLLVTILFWIPCALLWLPLLRFYHKDMKKLREKLKERAGLTFS